MHVLLLLLWWIMFYPVLLKLSASANAPHQVDAAMLMQTRNTPASKSSITGGGCCCASWCVVALGLLHCCQNSWKIGLLCRLEQCFFSSLSICRMESVLEPALLLLLLLAMVLVLCLE